MTLPRDWLTLALVGAKQSELPPPGGLPAPLARLAAALGDRPPAEAILLQAGATALHDDAGWVPARAEATEWVLPAFRAEGDRPPCSPDAARFLRGMLNQRHTDLLPELLERMNVAGQRVPDDLLPNVLEHGAKITRLRPNLLPVLGERGRWLGAINPAWRFAAVELHDWRSLRGAWEADPAGRVALIRTLRRSDPETARQLIEATWRAEPDAARRELLAALEAGLSADDEPFLERALDDRDALVRRKAAELLARLPDSRLVGRMTAAAGGFLALERGELVPRFPAQISDALVRDGVTRPTGSELSLNERSRLLSQTVGVIPPRFWEQRFNASPDELVGAARAGKWPRTLVAALAAAAARHRDRRWAQAIVTQEGLVERCGPLVPLMTAEEAATALTAAVASDDDGAVVVLLRRWPHAWDESGGRAVLDYLTRQAARGPETRFSPTLRFLSRQFARQCSPALAADAARALDTGIENKVWAAALRHIATTLALRREMQVAVGDDSAPHL